MVNWDLVKKLIQMVKEEEISGLAVEEDGVKYEVQRNAGGIVSNFTPPASEATSQQTQSTTSESSEDKDLIPITSPMVGTFYRSPSPESPPFVELGSDIEPGKVVCIIEAMKLYNEIESEVRGKVAKIIVENGQPVEYGQKLMLIKKA